MADLVPSLQLLGVGGLAEDPPSSLAVPGTWTIRPEQRRVASTMSPAEPHATNTHTRGPQSHTQHGSRIKMTSKKGILRAAPPVEQRGKVVLHLARRSPHSALPEVVSHVKHNSDNKLEVTADQWSAMAHNLYHLGGWNTFVKWFTCGAWIRKVSTDTSLTQAPQVKHDSCWWRRLFSRMPQVAPASTATGPWLPRAAEPHATKTHTRGPQSHTQHGRRIKMTSTVFVLVLLLSFSDPGSCHA